MTANVFWFSGTGNSLAVARRIAAALPGARLVAMAGADPAALTAAEHTVLVFPVYSWGPPGLVDRFIRPLPVVAGMAVDAVYTNGGDPGSTDHQLRRLLRKRRLRLRSTYSVTMVENYPPFGGAPGPERQQELLAAAEPEIGRIIRSLQRGESGLVANGRMRYRIIGRIVYPLFRWGARRSAGGFSVTEACNGCGLCKNLCPVGNIELADARPRWLNRCEQCYACFHWCPQAAVQHGKKTHQQHRYHHPDVTLKQITARTAG